jgi:rare lipoprotein A
MDTRQILSICLLMLFPVVTVAEAGITSSNGRVATGTASWYSSEACQFNPTKGCPTASGRSLHALEKEGIYFAAMWDVPFGTKVRVTNVSSGKSVIVVVWDRGPARRLKRPIDLSLSAFKKIADPKKGVIKVDIEVLKD